jgi:hypothetical protein
MSDSEVGHSGGELRPASRNMKSFALKNKRVKTFHDKNNHHYVHLFRDTFRQYEAVEEKDEKAAE